MGSSIGSPQEHESPRVFEAFDIDVISGTVEQSDLGTPDFLRAVCTQAPFEHYECCCKAIGYSYHRLVVTLQAEDTQTSTGVKVFAGPRAPPYSPAMTRTVPLPSGRFTAGISLLRMP